MNNTKKITYAVFFGFTLLFYQNCSKPTFTSVDDASDLAASSTPSVPVDTTNTAPPVTYDPTTLTNFSCTNVVELTPSAAMLEIPARDSSGTCYAIKMVSAVNYPLSSANPNVDTEVISRNHDNGYSDPTKVHNPYILGEAAARIYLDGARSLRLAGALNETTSIQVDNFLLIGVAPTPDIGQPSYYKAYGTSDSTVYSTGGVDFMNQVVLLTPFATGGTSTVAPLDLDSQITTKLDTTIDVRALDCGGQGVSSDIYLLFQ